MSDRDFQKSRLYAWENKVVGPVGGRDIPFDKAQFLINAVWMAAGLLYPPTLKPMPKQNRKAWAKANRTEVTLDPSKPTPEWVILHEIAHSMTGTFDGESDAHGPAYLWIYMTLLDRHLKIPLPMLMFTAQKAGLVFTVGAKPLVTQGYAA